MFFYTAVNWSVPTATQRGSFPAWFQAMSLICTFELEIRLQDRNLGQIFVVGRQRSIYLCP